MTNKPTPKKTVYKRTTKDAKELLTRKQRAQGRTISRKNAKFSLDLTDTVMESLCLAFEDGHFADSACNKLRIPQSLLKSWLEKGAKDAEKYSLLSQSGNHIKDKDISREYKLLARLAEANFTFEDALLGKIKVAEDWRAQMALLSKRFAKRWGDTSKVEVSANITAQHVFHSTREQTTEEWEADQKRIQDGAVFIDVTEKPSE